MASSTLTTKVKKVRQRRATSLSQPSLSQPSLSQGSNSSLSGSQTSPKRSAKGQATKTQGAAHHRLDQIFILWGEHFFESAAVIFATTLREAGLSVKLVGLNGMQAAGHNRIGIQSDLSVTAALELRKRICTLILPCSQAALTRMGNDPRLYQLFAAAADNSACFLVAPEVSPTVNALNLLGAPPHLVIAYSQEYALITFAKQLAAQLADKIAADTERVGTFASLTFSIPN